MNDPILFFVGVVLGIAGLMLLATAYDSGIERGDCEGRCHPAAAQLRQGTCSCATAEGTWQAVPGWVAP